MEKDDEVKGQGNSYDFGARMYDSRLGRWSSVDPLSQFVGSQYSSSANNPILLKDIDGRWVPGVTSSGTFTLTAEKGDNTETLLAFLGGKENALKIVHAKYIYKNLENQKNNIALNHTYESGQFLRIKSDNVYTKALRWHIKDSKSGDGDGWSNTNCHSTSLLGSRGQSIVELGGENNLLNRISDGVRDEILKEQYNEIEADKDGDINLKENGVIGKTIVTFGEGHTGIYFGTDNEGNDYFLNKDNAGGDYTIKTLEETKKYYNYKGDIKAYTIKLEYDTVPLTNEKIDETIEIIQN